MKLSNREKDVLQAPEGTAKSALSAIPGLGQAIAGFDSYNRSQFERNIVEVINHLKSKVENIENCF